MMGFLQYLGPTLQPSPCLSSTRAPAFRWIAMGVVGGAMPERRLAGLLRAKRLGSGQVTRTGRTGTPGGGAAVAGPGTKSSRHGAGIMCDSSPSAGPSQAHQTKSPSSPTDEQSVAKLTTN